MRARQNGSHLQVYGWCPCRLVPSDVAGIRDRNIGDQRSAIERPDQSFLVKPG